MYAIYGCCTTLWSKDKILYKAFERMKKDGHKSKKLGKKEN